MIFPSFCPLCFFISFPFGSAALSVLSVLHSDSDSLSSQVYSDTKYSRKHNERNQIHLRREKEERETGMKGRQSREIHPCISSFTLFIPHSMDCSILLILSPLTWHHTPYTLTLHTFHSSSLISFCCNATQSLLFFLPLLFLYYTISFHVFTSFLFFTRQEKKLWEEVCSEPQFFPRSWLG